MIAASTVEQGCHHAGEDGRVKGANLVAARGESPQGVRLGP